jgi:hypothetical protein
VVQARVLANGINMVGSAQNYSVELACNGDQWSERAYEYWEGACNTDRYYLIETEKDYAKADGKDGKNKVTPPRD